MQIITKEEEKSVTGMFEQIIEFELKYKDVSLKRVESTSKINFYVDEVTNNLFNMFLSGYCFRKHICEEK